MGVFVIEKFVLSRET